MVKTTRQENICSSILNGYMWDKMGCVKAREQDIVVKISAWTRDLAVWSERKGWILEIPGKKYKIHI